MVYTEFSVGETNRGGWMKKVCVRSGNPASRELAKAIVKKELKREARVARAVESIRRQALSLPMRLQKLRYPAKSARGRTRMK